MNYFERLLIAGICPDAAFEAFIWYETQSESGSIADYVEEVEGSVGVLQPKPAGQSSR